MQKVESPDGYFHEGNPVTGELGTIVSATWLNSVQNELVGLVEGAGGVIDANAKNQISQLLFKTQAQFDNSKKLATTEFVKRAGMQFAGQVNISTSTILNAATHAGMFINVANTVSNITLTLPVASTIVGGGCLYIQNATNYTTTISRQSSNLIYVTASGIQSLTLLPGDSVLLETDGYNWYASGTGVLSAGASFASVKGTSGYQKLPSGMIIQWAGGVSSAAGFVSVSYPIAFPNAAYSVLLVPYLGGPSNIVMILNFDGNPSRALAAAVNTANAYTSVAFGLLAIGA